MAKETRKYADRATYLKKAVDLRRKKIRSMALEYGGGKCVLCGYKTCIQALEFHHLDSKGKDFGVSAKGYTRSWDKVKKEIDKCALLCANCHRETHAGITQLSVVRRTEKQGELREA
jgi:5-methylcytosine-specific restriction endonuclease McrA